MLGKTHVLGGMSCCLATFVLMEHEGMLIPEVNELLQLGVALPYAVWASTLPDRDQDNKYKAEENPINLAVQKFFRFLNVPHRGAISHLYPTIIVYAILIYLFRCALISPSISSNLCIAILITVGISSGLLSHTILDCFTMQGICGGKIRFVPRNSALGTTGPDGKPSFYERFCRKSLYVVTCILLVYCIYLCVR